MTEHTPSPPLQVGPPSPNCRPATLWKDNQEIATGWTHYEEGSRKGKFYPRFLPLHSIERHGVVLKVTGTAIEVLLKEVVPCLANMTDHYDYWVTEPPE